MKTQKDSTFNKQIEVTKGKLLGEGHGMGEEGRVKKDEEQSLTSATNTVEPR